MRFLYWSSIAWRYLWPSPYTLLGLLVFFIPIRGARSLLVHRGTIGVIGPAIERLLVRVPIIGGAAAMTFGHSILAKDRDTFYSTWDHERVHVDQYQRWGLLFVPMYLGAGLWLKIRGKDPYWDNPFEIEARRLGDGIDC
ncbi:MAG: hypothetical protein LW724_13875 [Planctomycetaceae bacterium]|jgi:hypothetical protein|nr:hypothetical protein [Planctomycetaceae bacterium]